MAAYRDFFALATAKLRLLKYNNIKAPACQAFLYVTERSRKKA